MHKLIVILLFPLLLSCELDHGLGLIKTRITGHVILPDLENRPEYLESVRVIATTKNLADLQQGELSLSDVIFSNSPVNLSQQTPSYDLPAPAGEYKLIAAVWKKRGEAWDYTRFLGFHGFNPDSFTFDFEPVVLTKNDPIAENIDIYCDWSFVSP
ncbi:MAG: hypothetical protein U5R06_02625 [candidate division KSB1 bacterium]|nr:hypothetical protein [candidate division KSB1 bacterium]